MMTSILIAIAAGCASALMAASHISGVLLSALLVFLSPLPLMVAGLGWGSASALVGGVGAGILLALGVSLSFGLNYLLTIAAPAVWLGHVSLLAQPAAASPSAPGHAAALEWYPIGRVVLWTAIISALIMILQLLMTGDNGAEMTARHREQALQMLDALTQAGMQIENKPQLAATMARMLPLAAVGMAMLMYLLNLWLAARIAQTSHRLRRPWPSLRATELPQTTLVALAAALLLSFAGGLVALIAQVVGAALLTAYTIVGFAVLHYFTPFSSGRLWWRLSAYGAVIIFVWPVLLIAIIGLLDASFGLRRRFGGATGSSTPST